MPDTTHAIGPADPAAKPSCPRCHLPRQEMSVHAKGTVEPCCYWTAHGNANPPLGNINDNSIDEIWNNANYQKLRHHMLRGELEEAGCANCYAIKQGQGLGLEYDKDCKLPRYADTPYAANIKLLKEEIRRGATRLGAKPTIVTVTASHDGNLDCRHCGQHGSR